MSVTNPEVASTFETQGQEHYANHLASINENNAVISTEDIVNARGVLMVRKGARIDSQASLKLARHKLMRPLEEQIQIARCLDGARIRDCLHGLLDKYPDLKQIHIATRFEVDCDYLIRERKLNHLLVQKMTVQHQQQPGLFEKNLFCAWLSALVAREMRLDADTMHSAFIAGLMHDVGFLHIDPAIMEKSGTLTPAEWRTIQSHVAIGHLILKNIPGIPPRIARAVLEHHERCDGTGYPVGRLDTQLDVLGQIVGLADSLQAIRVNQFEGCGRNLRDAMPYLQVNPTTHFYIVYQAISSILKKSGLSTTTHNAFGSIASLSGHLHKRAEALRSMVAELGSLPETLQPYADKPRVKSLLKVAERVVTMIASSGLTRDELASWLNSLQDLPDEAALPELNEIELMQNELYWQIKKLRQVFGEFLDKECDPDSAGGRPLHAIAAGIDACLDTRA